MRGPTPREAATVILLRDRTPLEVLMVERNPANPVMGGVWAFPGGVVAAADGSGEAAWRAAAIRELAEETSITGLEPADLVPFARWIAPVSLPVRFDAHFFLARAPAGQTAIADSVECIDAVWFTVEEALARGRDGTLPLLFPTRMQLQRLLPYRRVDELIDAARAEPVRTIQPRLRFPGDRADPLLPGQPGYELARG
jgi:8-oxo-dGTP pyrophosphatase MutT (NUDIX family)